LGVSRQLLVLKSFRSLTDSNILYKYEKRFF
jgi:hypothetical protein